MVKLSKDSSIVNKWKKQYKKSSVKSLYSKSDNKYGELINKYKTLIFGEEGVGNIKGIIPRRPDILKDVVLAKRFRDVSGKVNFKYGRASKNKSLDERKRLLEEAIKEEFESIDPRMQEYIDAYFEYATQWKSAVKSDRLTIYGIILCIFFFFFPYTAFLTPIIIPIVIFYAIKKSSSK